MVKLVAPKSGFNRYIVREGFLMGPLGLGQDAFETISEFRSSFDLITDSKGIYGENPVQHQQAKGLFQYNPLYGSAVRSPITGSWNYPDNVKVPTGATTYINCNCGIGAHGAVGFFESGNFHYQNAYCVLEDQLDVFAIYKIGSYIQGDVSLCQKVEYHGFKDYYGYTQFYQKTTTYGTNLTKTGIDWFTKQSFATIVDFCESRVVYSVSADSLNTTSSVRPYILNAPPLSPGAVKSTVDGLIYPLFLEDYPEPPKDWGDMAMEASEKVNASSVNMLEFLSDLRHPTQMIPKLAKLKTIKGLADNYLTISYGVLPTIDDVKSIYEACQKRKPFLDKCGFSVFTSAASSSSSTDRYDRLIEQHLKLAIDDEDSTFQAIVGNVESVGMLPTCNNLWELLPYSFVVDWLVDVGGLLERVDARMRLTRLNIRYVTYSTKWTTSIKVDWCPEFPYFSQLDWVVYHRWVSDQCPRPNLSLHSSFQDFDHWLESGALILQRRK